MRYRAVLFDLDGVLVDACEWHYEALNKALREVYNNDERYAISREEHDSQYNGLPTSVKYRRLLHESNTRYPRVAGLELRVAALKQVYTLEYIARLSPDPVKTELLAWLRGCGIKVGCVTNSIRQTAEAMLVNTGQLPYMDILISNEEVVAPKPSPEGYLQAMISLSVRPEETLIVEDSPKGQEAALGSGADLLIVPNAEVVTKNLLLTHLVEE